MNGNQQLNNTPVARLSKVGHPPIPTFNNVTNNGRSKNIVATYGNQQFGNFLDK